MMLEAARREAPDDDSMTAPARLYNTDLTAFAEQLSNGGRIEAGCVTVIGLDAIRERLGDRWPRRREQVWEAFERLLERRLPSSALHARIGDADYLVEAGRDLAEAQATSFKLLQEAHFFFLGERRPDGMRVETVTDLVGSRIKSRRLAHPGFSEPAPEEVRTFAPPPPAEIEPSRWSSLSFAQASHRVRVAYERQSVISLSVGRASALRLRPVILIDGAPVGPGGEGLTHAERTAVDQATMGAVLGFGDAPIVAPFFFETLSSTRGRGAMLAVLEGRSAPKGLITELVGIDGGTPQFRVLETVSLVLPYCAGVIAQAPVTRACAKVVNGARLCGLSIDCEEGPSAKISVLAALADCRDQADAGRLLFAFGLPSSSSLASAHAAGATHASLSAAAG
jgi:hypothetical protein